jgi:solute carrier family 34 (sodium-dependent phosphate cotransporter)
VIEPDSTPTLDTRKLMLRPGLSRAAAAVAGLALFVLALELLKAAAGELAPLLSQWHVSGLRQSVGFGWLGAYVVLSGSPVAAIALTLYSTAVLNDLAALGMMTGSRLGASFIVLFVGFLYYLRGERRVASVAIGVLAFAVTATIYLPALALGVFVLKGGWLDGVQFGTPAALDSAIDLIFDPIVVWIQGIVPFWGVFVAGLASLLGAFKVFDAVLPEVDPERSRFANLASAIYRPMVMFFIGALFTSMTLSVSVSLTLLVPLSTRGYIRRENVVPYIMGANITTFVDTLFASLLLNSPRAFTIVLVEVICVSFFSLIILLFFYRPYQRIMNQLLDTVLANRWSMLTFVGVLIAVPLLLLFL